MNILFVYPPCPDTFWNLRYALKFISKKALLPPLGLLTVAAMLPKYWHKKLIDMTIDPLTDEDIIWADYVFISAMHIHRDAAEKVIARCKSLGAKIVAGGPLFTTEYDRFDLVDHLVLNEAEVTLPLFLHDLQNGCARHIYTSGRKADITETPIPVWELIDMKKYACMPVQYSRGCPFNCTFCDVTVLFGNKTRAKTSPQFLAELDSLYSHGWTDQVFIVDDNFIGSKKPLKNDVLPPLIQWQHRKGRPFAFTTQTSINLCQDDELMDMMVNAGFEAVFIGVETPNDKAFEECDKLQNKNRDLIGCVKKIQQRGLQVQAGFILGFDSDDASIFEKLINFIQTSGIVMAMVGLLNVPKATRLYTRLAKENRLLGDSCGNNTDLTLNFIPKMDPAALIAGYTKVVHTIYSHRFYHQRILKLLKNYRPLPKTRRRVNAADIKTLLRSIWFLGLRGTGKNCYWKLLFWTLFHCPENTRLAVTLAAYGFHFRKMFSTY